MNNVVLVGRLVRDPDVRYGAENQTAVARFRVAVDRPNSKERQSDFPSCVAFGRTAEFIEKYFTKGRLIGIQGHIQTGSYQKDGATVYTTDVVVERVEFVGSKAENGGDYSGGGAPAARTNSMPAGIPEGFQALEDDDMPF